MESCGGYAALGEWYNTPFHVTLFPPLYRAAFMENNVEDVGAQQ